MRTGGIIQALFTLLGMECIQRTKHKEIMNVKPHPWGDKLPDIVFVPKHAHQEGEICSDV